MIRLRPELTRALRESAGQLIDEGRDNGAALVRVKGVPSSFSLLSRIATLALTVLEEQGYVQIRGFPLEPARPLFLALAELMGLPCVDPATGTAIVAARVRPGELITGDRLRRLPLHTDYSAMERPPRLSMSYCVRADAVPGFGAVSVADIAAECHGLGTIPETRLLKRTLLPFAGHDAGGAVDVIDRPILTPHPEKNTPLVRYHRSRIVQGFQYRGVKPTGRQASAMRSFERLAGAAARVLHPEAGDVLVIDNHRTVHARERCSVELSLVGTTSGPQTLFLFAH